MVRGYAFWEGGYWHRGKVVIGPRDEGLVLWEGGYWAQGKLPLYVNAPCLRYAVNWILTTLLHFHWSLCTVVLLCKLCFHFRISSLISGLLYFIMKSPNKNQFLINDWFFFFFMEFPLKKQLKWCQCLIRKLSCMPFVLWSLFCFKRWK